MTDTDASSTAKAAHDLANKAFTASQINGQRMTSHEMECARRYSEIVDNVKTLRNWMVGAFTTAFVLLLGMFWQLLQGTIQ